MILVCGILSAVVLVSAPTLAGQTRRTVGSLEAAIGATEADQVSVSAGETTLTGHVIIQVNGVMVSADRVVIQQDGEYRLEGNVRMKVPTPAAP